MKQPYSRAHADLAVIGFTDMATARLLIGGIRTKYGMALSDQRIADVLAVGVERSRMSLGELWEALAIGVPPGGCVARTQRFEEVAAALCMSQTRKGIEAGAELEAALRELEESAESRARLGFVATDPAGELLPLSLIVAPYRQGDRGFWLAEISAESLHAALHGCSSVVLVLVSYAEALIRLVDHMDQDGAAERLARQISQSRRIELQTSRALSNLVESARAIVAQGRSSW